MHPKKHYQIGDLVFILVDGKLKSHEIVQQVEDVMYLVLSCEDLPHPVWVHESEIFDVSEAHRTQKAIASQTYDLWEAHTCGESYLDSLSDEELEALAPPESAESAPVIGTQSEYDMVYDAATTEMDILAMLLEFSNTSRVLGDVALLALRDRAEFIGSQSLVKAIDDYMEDKNRRNDMFK